MTLLHDDARSLAEVFDLDYPDELIPADVEGRRRWRLEQVAHWHAEQIGLTEELTAAFVRYALAEDTARRSARLEPRLERIRARTKPLDK